MKMCSIYCGHHGIVLLTVYVVIVIAATANGMESDVCPAGEGSTFKFVVNLHINRTGHRVVSVNMDHHTPNYIDERNDTGLYVTHTSNACGKMERIEIKATAVIFEHIRPKRPGYEFFSELGYYKLHTWGRTWDDARATCLEEGGHLLVINSEEEANVVKRFFSRKPVFENVNDPLYGVYVGINDVESEGKFITVLGQRLEDTGYTKWQPGEPKHDRGQNYVAVQKDALMHDINNGKRMGFICEVEG